MSYTMTFDASHKVGRGGHARAFFRHIARDVDQEAGFHYTHANKNIVAARTRLNLTQVNDGAGGFRKPRSIGGRAPSDELDDYLTTRLATVEKALRKDAVLVRGIILQLDPKWFDAFNPDWRENGLNREAVAYTDASLVWACREFGQENIVGFALHLDEYNPQLQVMMTPVTADGRLAQKDYFKGPSDFRRQHKELRECMAAAGYEVEHRVTERSREHLSSSEFQTKADRLRDATQDVEDDKATYETLLVSLSNRESNLDGREAHIAIKEVEAAAAREKARQAIEAAQAAERQAIASRIAADRTQEEAERERDLLRAANRRLEHVSPDVDRWLDKVKWNGTPAREHFERDVAKVRATRAEVRRLVESDPSTTAPEILDAQR